MNAILREAMNDDTLEDGAGHQVNTYLIIYTYKDGDRVPVITDIAGGFKELQEYIDDDRPLMEDYNVTQIEILVKDPTGYIHVDTIQR